MTNSPLMAPSEGKGQSEVLHWVARMIALAATTLSAPIFPLVALAIRLDSKGPAIFRQRRVGRHEQVFTIYKFRTLTSDTTELPTHHLSAGDVTRVGSFLRRYKIDELPQLWNVVRGDMGFVGPRPCLESQQVLIEERRARGVFAKRPGVTGPAQVANVDMSTPVRLAEIDAAYVAEKSLMTDLGYIFQTLRGSGRGDQVSSE